MTPYNQIQMPRDEFDHQALLAALADYRSPRDRITKLLRRGEIIRVKKGLYVFGSGHRRGVVSKELLANLIHGPSYVSLEYALAYHGLIPERVETVTSVTLTRARAFDTPVGRFTYQRIPLTAFRAGVARVDAGRDRFFLMAVAEKALADKIQCDKVALNSQKAVREYLIQDLRIEESGLSALDPDRFDDYAERYGSRKIKLLAKVVRRLAGERGGVGHA